MKSTIFFAQKFKKNLVSINQKKFTYFYVEAYKAFFWCSNLLKSKLLKQNSSLF